MLINNGLHWSNVGNQLEQYVLQNYPTNYYFNSYSLSNINPFLNITPRQNIFFGPKVLNIFIVGYPYGAKKTGSTWYIDWGQFASYKQTIKDCFDKWTFNETHFYADKTVGDQAVAGSPICGPTLKGLMDQLFELIKADCNGEMKDYGWKWRGELTSLVGSSYFQQEIDDFYNQPA